MTKSPSRFIASALSISLMVPFNAPSRLGGPCFFHWKAGYCSLFALDFSAEALRSRQFGGCNTHN